MMLSGVQSSVPDSEYLNALPVEINQFLIEDESPLMKTAKILRFIGCTYDAIPIPPGTFFEESPFGLLYRNHLKLNVVAACLTHHASYCSTDNNNPFDGLQGLQECVMGVALFILAATNEDIQSKKDDDIWLLLKRCSLVLFPYEYPELIRAYRDYHLI